MALSACGTAMDLLDRDPPRSDTFLQISRDGVGPLDATTPYSETAIGQVMPGLKTGTVLVGLETETTNAIVLFKTDETSKVQVLHIIGRGAKIREIHGVSRYVVGPGGERPGMTLAQARVDPATCRPGTALWLGMAICKSRMADNVSLTFSLKGDAATSARLPGRAELEQGELQRIIWTPNKAS